MPWSPADWNELIRTIFYGIAALCVPLATVYIMISARRIDRLGANMALLEKNTNSISERNQAIAMKLGITEGIAQERASVQANVVPVLHPKGGPLPVADDRAAEIAIRGVEATERLADAAEKKETP